MFSLSTSPPPPSGLLYEAKQTSTGISVNMSNSPLHIKSMTPQYSPSPIRSRASSATSVEIQAGLLLLQWAQNRKISSICIQTDCLVFVQGLLKPDRLVLLFIWLSVISCICVLFLMRSRLLKCQDRQLMIELEKS